MFYSVEAVIEADDAFSDSESESEPKSEYKSEDEFNFLLSNFFLISNNGQKYGPFGTDSIERKPVTIQIGNGDVLAQATSSFIYAYGGEKTFKNDKCFSFYVSNESQISGLANGSRAETIERLKNV